MAAASILLMLICGACAAPRPRAASEAAAEVPCVVPADRVPLESLLDYWGPRGVIVMVAGPDSDTLYRPTPLDYQKHLYANHSLTPAHQPLEAGYLLAVHLDAAPDHALQAGGGYVVSRYADPDHEGVGHELDYWQDREVEFMIAGNLFNSGRRDFIANYLHHPGGQEQGLQIDQVRAQYPAAGTRVCTGGFVGVIMTPILTDTGAAAKSR